MATADDAKGWVEALTGCGFAKVSVINKSYQVLHSTGPDANPAAWQNSEGATINENQELVDNWFDEKRHTFKFFKTSYNIISKDEWGSGNGCVVAAKGNQYLIACITPDVWIMCSGSKKGKDPTGKDLGGSFVNAPGAYNEGCKAVFDELKEDL